jgi:hypothetical protein
MPLWKALATDEQRQPVVEPQSVFSKLEIVDYRQITPSVWFDRGE